ncbi:MULTISPECIES: cysteine peptidase family C39 domain-containing protein [Thiorhodovibrio]|uniref:cysteine peptidase family C39 domain-containing protein n=1 Tax=Thiorhodovibrio TaxID=61593 RepID=UPI001913271D|nr:MULTISPECIES: cysteine peptidase family C39 domain-containing protein [Thiorhodovibrio]MBK5970286.1 hypothetical protein [Thiorhodovibrio winogradskyi]WPL14855.1 Lactococcin-G-processing and transport ATP-binding protein LagD [Thiorhodovibrio litoralis]
MSARKPVVGVVRTPTILQMEALECGAAALAMVLAHYGRWEPLEKLRLLCGVSRDGSKAINLVKAARVLGLKASGKRLEPADLASLPVPAILFVGMNHFVVLEGVSKGKFQLNDPAAGRRLLTAKEFDELFTGLVLAFEPTDAFQPGGTAPSILPSLWAMARQSLWPLGLLALAGLLLAVFSILMPGLQQIYIDRILIEQFDNWVYPLAIILAVIAPVMAFLTWLHARLIAALNAKLSIVLTSRLAWRVLRLPVLFFGQRYAGMISARVGLADQLVLTLTQSLSQVLSNVALVLLLTLLMLQYSLSLTLIVIGMSLFNALLFQRLRKSLGEASEKVAMQTVKMGGKVMQGVRMMETLKSTGTDDLFFSQWSGLQVLYINAQQAIAKREALIAGLQTWLASLTAALVLVVGGYYTMTEQFSIGMLVAFSVITVLFNQPVTVLVSLAGMLQQTQGAIAQLDDTLGYPLAREFDELETDTKTNFAEASQRPTTAPLRRLSGQVRLEQVGCCWGLGWTSRQTLSCWPCPMWTQILSSGRRPCCRLNPPRLMSCPPWSRHWSIGCAR